MKRLERYIHPYWGFIFLTVFIKLSGAVLELSIPYFMEIVLDHKVPAGAKSDIFLFGGLMMLCAAGCLGCNILANRMSAISSGKITRAIRHDLFYKLQHLSARQLDELTVPSAESRLTSDTYNVNQLLAGNDVKMAAGYPERVKQAMDLGAVTRADLERCAKRVLEFIMKID